MKITKIDIVILDTPNNPPLWRPVLCRVYTDNGLYGDGEAALAYGRGAYAAFGRELAPLLIGKNPLDNEPIWETLYKSTFWGQNGGAVAFAGISALDVALWDIKGKYYKEPVYRLLGGKRREKLRCYASQLQFGWGSGKDKAMLVDPQAYAETALIAQEEGYDALKVDVLAMDGQGNWNQQDLSGVLPDRVLRRGYDRLAAMRKAVGPDMDIIVEMHSFTSTIAAIQFGRMIAELGVLYYEEPVMPLNPKQMKKVADNVPIPIAAGERIYWRWGYRPFLEEGSVSVIQPDICTCGGITEVKKICDMAHVYDATVQIHVCGGPISTAAALHMEAAIPNFMIHELHRYALLEPNTRTCVHNYMPEKGMYSVPELPGLGQELTPETIAASTVVTVK